MSDTRVKRRRNGTKRIKRKEQREKPKPSGKIAEVKDGETFFEVEGLSNFNTKIKFKKNSTEIESVVQRYKVHWRNDVPSVKNATEISAVSIHLYWVKVVQQMRLYKKKQEEKEEITEEEEKKHKENLASLAKLEFLKENNVDIEYGLDAEKELPYMLKRYKHRLSNNHPDPFGEDSDPDDPRESEASDEEEESAEPSTSKLELETTMQQRALRGRCRRRNRRDECLRGNIYSAS